MVNGYNNAIYKHAHEQAFYCTCLSVWWSFATTNCCLQMFVLGDSRYYWVQAIRYWPAYARVPSNIVLAFMDSGTVAYMTTAREVVSFPSCICLSGVVPLILMRFFVVFFAVLVGFRFRFRFYFSGTV